MPAPLHLASASPRRLELLLQAGFAPIPRPTGIREESDRTSPVRDRVLALAEAKGRHVLASLAAAERRGVVLAADTVVVVDDRALGKPRGPEEAVGMLRLLSGRSHEVLTGVFAARADEGRSAGLVDSTTVRFRAYGEEFIRWYVSTGEPMDKAGGYGIQGRGALLAEGIEGSWSNVVGLPLERIPELFSRIGFDVLDYLMI